MTTLGIIIAAFLAILFLVLGIREAKKKKEQDAYHKDLSVKAMRLTELQDILSDPTISEPLRNAVRGELNSRLKKFGEGSL